MSTNYDLRKALYSFLDVKVNSANQIAIDTSNKFKVIKVEAGSIVNIFISAQKESGSANSIYIGALSSTNVNEYYSDFLIKVYWDASNTIYILNDDANIKINSIFVEFLKGKLVETYLSSSTTDLSELTSKITVNSVNVNRINYKDQSLTFKSEYDTLVNDFNSFKNNYNAWKDTLGLYSQVDKLVPNSKATLIGKEKRIGDYIDELSIHSKLLIDESIVRGKLDYTTVVSSLDLADTSVQSITLNGGENLKDVNKLANINALTKLKVLDFNASEQAGSSIYKEYNVGADGVISISDWSQYIQPRLLGVTGDLLYFSGTDTLSNINISNFLMDSDILTTSSGWGTVNDVTVPSSLLVKNALDGKVDKLIDRTPVTTLSLMKITINNQGQVTSNTNVSQSDLTNIIGNYYLTVSYEFDPINGVLELL